MFFTLNPNDQLAILTVDDGQGDALVGAGTPRSAAVVLLPPPGLDAGELPVTAQVFVALDEAGFIPPAPPSFQPVLWSPPPDAGELPVGSAPDSDYLFFYGPGVVPPGTVAPTVLSPDAGEVVPQPFQFAEDDPGFSGFRPAAVAPWLPPAPWDPVELGTASAPTLAEDDPGIARVATGQAAWFTLPLQDAGELPLFTVPALVDDDPGVSSPLRPLPLTLYRTGDVLWSLEIDFTSPTGPIAVFRVIDRGLPDVQLRARGLPDVSLSDRSHP